MSDQNSVYGNEGRQVPSLTPRQQAWVAVLQQLKSERELARDVATAEGQGRKPTAIADEARLRVLQVEHAVNRHIDYAYGNGELHDVWGLFHNEGFKWRYETIGLVRYDAPGDWKSGPEAWLIDLVAPFSGGGDVLQDLKEKVLVGWEVRVRGEVGGEAA